MRGIHRVVVQNKRIRYDFELCRNLTVLRGDSATGKTTLIDMIREYIDNGADSSIDLICDKKCYVLEGTTWKGQLSEMYDSIVFVDEGNAFVFTDNFSEAIRHTDNYYVIVSREGLPNLPYSVTEIYGIRTSGRYAGLKQHYNEFYRIYGAPPSGEDIFPQKVIVEDSNAGYQFFRHVCDDNGINCVSAGGKSNILREARETRPDVETLLVADGAAFGPEMDRVMKYLQGHDNLRLYVPESFEWLILCANPMKSAAVREMLDQPAEHIDSGEYFSWERFFTRYLTACTQGSYLQYAKNRLNPSYLKGMICEAILKEMHGIHLQEG